MRPFNTAHYEGLNPAFKRNYERTNKTKQSAGRQLTISLNRQAAVERLRPCIEKRKNKDSFFDKVARANIIESADGRNVFMTLKIVCAEKACVASFDVEYYYHNRRVR